MRLAQETPDYPEYAQALYVEAMAMLQNVVDGLVTLPEVDEIVDTGGHLTAQNFTATEPLFTMDQLL